jgi:hypothetical protein
MILKRAMWGLLDSVERLQRKQYPWVLSFKFAAFGLCGLVLRNEHDTG